MKYNMYDVFISQIEITICMVEFTAEFKNFNLINVEQSTFLRFIYQNLHLYAMISDIILINTHFQYVLTVL